MLIAQRPLSDTDNSYTKVVEPNRIVAQRPHERLARAVRSSAVTSVAMEGAARWRLPERWTAIARAVQAAAQLGASWSLSKIFRSCNWILAFRQIPIECMPLAFLPPSYISCSHLWYPTHPESCRDEDAPSRIVEAPLQNKEPRKQEQRQRSVDALLFLLSIGNHAHHMGE
jgi:hypothetical protein